ncbi:sugar ABC transporter permease [Paenibacillus montaniterrae]|uniref:Sugar ABC transporter permease n=1 Tax=Paenibacillus montaniterrae TaxID=429341 RepID=A0A919YLV6_9BACL|nr:ABC transporter permease subunit [Paenibacillus montaniterrae]GIP15610.1 sugar ABC transporter permease [Paenibacillus montaniterrae]
MSSLNKNRASLLARDRKDSKLTVLGRDLIRNRYIYLMLLPVIVYYAIFHYGPMYGLLIAFKNYGLADGVWGSPWVGFAHFQSFFENHFFWRLIRNTLLINLYELLFAFPAPIILALLLNELRLKFFKRVVQTISYLPHFISIVVVVGMLVDFVARDGLINNILAMFGMEPIAFLQEPGWFRSLYISSGVWQGVGWGSIIYLAAMSTIDPSLYDAARIDGAGRWRQTLSVTLPGIMPTIVILLILNIGSMMSVGSEKIILMYNPLTYETADVISTYVYRKGILGADFGYSAAVGLFNSIVSFILIMLANTISKAVSDHKLW